MRLLETLRSLRLALGLLLLLALFSVPGTPLPQETGARYYRSPLISIPLLLFTVNVLLCTWHRISRRLRAPASGGGGARNVLDAAMHLSLAVILAGGSAKALFGSVGTQYLFTGVETATVYDWKLKEQAPLGFSLLLKERVEDHYPLVLRIGVSEAETGRNIAVLQPREGTEAALPGGGLVLSVEGYDPEGMAVRLGSRTEGGREVHDLDLFPEGRTRARSGPYDLTVMAWRRDLKNMRGRVAVIEDGREVKEGWLSVNGRLAHGGWSVFLTAWGEDQYRNPYLGIQASRDPGAPLFWSGATLLAVSLPLFLIVRHRRR